MRRRTKSVLTVASVVCFALAALPLSAQLRVVPQGVLDSVAHPATVKTAMAFDTLALHAGQMSEDAAPSTYTFTWRNAGTTPIVITRVETTCGCLTAAFDKQPVTSGRSARVDVTFNPKGRVGSFQRKIFVYTTASAKQPSAILELIGSVVVSKMHGDFVYAMGDLRLKQRSVLFAGTRTQSERIECVNVGEKPLMPTCNPEFLPKGFSFRCEPAELKPGMQGDLVINFEPNVAGELKSRKFVLLLEGVGTGTNRNYISVEMKE